MKKKYKIFSLFIIMVFLSVIQVEAITGTTVISESPSNTEKGNYIVLKHSINESINGSISLSYSYDTSYLKLVGFTTDSSTSCSFNGTVITCTGTISSGTYFVYPVFKITSTLNSNKEIKTSMTVNSDTTTTTTTITKTDKEVDVTNVSVEENSKSMIVGDTYQIKASVTPTDATDTTVKYSSSDTEVATVDNSGLVTALSKGETNITVSSGSVSTNVIITVSDAEIELEGISSIEELDLIVGEVGDLELTLSPDDATIDVSSATYLISDEDVITINQNKEIVALKSGEATVTITLGEQKTTTKVIVTEEEIEVQKESHFIPCLISVVVTTIVIFVGLFIRKLIKRRKELNNDDSNDEEDEQLNTYI